MKLCKDLMGGILVLCQMDNVGSDGTWHLTDITLESLVTYQVNEPYTIII